MATDTAREIYRAMQMGVAVVMLGGGLLGFIVDNDDNGNGLPAGATIQSGSVITGHQPGNFNDDVKLDTSEVSAP
jgi:hypothetical protein